MVVYFLIVKFYFFNWFVVCFSFFLLALQILIANVLLYLSNLWKTEINELNSILECLNLFSGVNDIILIYLEVPM